MRLLTLVLLTVSITAPSSVRAGGFDYPSPGTRALGRGGTFYARADDPMALLYNPANLASLSPNQLMLNAHVAWFDLCFQPAGQYDPNAFAPTIFDEDPEDMDTWGGWGRAHPEICNTGPPGISPDLAFTTTLAPNLGIGFGLVAPAAVGHTTFADEVDPGTVTVDGQLLPAPARYLLMEQQLIIAYPTIGVGWRPVRWFQFGGAFQWGMGSLHFANMTRATPGQSPDQDVRSELTATDFFIPAAIVSAHFIPHDNLDVVISGRYAADVDASGETKLTWGAYVPPSSASGAPERADTIIPDTQLHARQPWSLALGVRYADRFTPRPENVRAVERLSRRVEDPMSNEHWDVELDVVYERNSRIDEFVVTLPEGSRLMQPPSTPLPLPTEIRIPHNYQDQLSIRLGGDYNVIPGLAALRLGASFETRGVDPSYVGIDFLPGQRFGIHGGLTVRLGRVDISLAYAHIFQETSAVPECPARTSEEVMAGITERDRTARCEANDQAAFRQISANTPEAGHIVNAGTYTANFDVLSLGVTWHIP